MHIQSLRSAVIRKTGAVFLKFKVGSNGCSKTYHINSACLGNWIYFPVVCDLNDPENGKCSYAIENK